MLIKILFGLLAAVIRGSIIGVMLESIRVTKEMPGGCSKNLDIPSTIIVVLLCCMISALPIYG